MAHKHLSIKEHELGHDHTKGKQFRVSLALLGTLASASSRYVMTGGFSEVAWAPSGSDVMGSASGVSTKRWREPGQYNVIAPCPARSKSGPGRVESKTRDPKREEGR